jgi:transcriptional regulator
MERDRSNAWQLSALGEAGIERRLPLIVGFEITIDRVEAKLQTSNQLPAAA